MATQPRLSSGNLPPGVKLTQFQARVWEWLSRRSHLPQGICQAAKTLAAAFGCCRRYVELTLRFFVELGVLRRVVDYGLRTRRRYFVVGSPADVPLFPADAGGCAAPPETNFFGAPECAQPAHPSAPTDVPPLDPPMCVSGDEEMEGSGECAPPDSPAAPPAKSDASPSPPEIVPAPKGDEEPTPEQVEQLVAKAKEILPAQPRGWILALAGRWTLGWVRAALGRAAELVAEGRAVKPGFVITVLKGFAAEGGPPVAPAAVDPVAEEKAKLERVQAKWEGRMKEILREMKDQR